VDTKNLPTDSRSNQQPSTNAGDHGQGNAAGRPVPRLRHMVVSIALPSEVMNKRILEKLVRPPSDMTARGT
jgi:hypothetical protein